MAESDYRTGLIVAVDEDGRTEVRMAGHPEPVVVKPGELVRVVFQVGSSWSVERTAPLLEPVSGGGQGERE